MCSSFGKAAPGCCGGQESHERQQQVFWAGLSWGMGGGESSGWLPAVWEQSLQELLTKPMGEVMGRGEKLGLSDW